MGELGEGLSGLRGTIEDRDVFQVSRKGVDGKGWRLDGSGRQPTEGKEDLGMDVEDFDLGEGGPEGVGMFLQSGCTGGVGFWGRDVDP